MILLEEATAEQLLDEIKNREFGVIVIIKGHAREKFEKFAKIYDTRTESQKSTQNQIRLETNLDNLTLKTLISQANFYINQEF